MLILQLFILYFSAEESTLKKSIIIISFPSPAHFQEVASPQWLLPLLPGEGRSPLTIQLLHRDVGQLFTVAASRERAVQVVSFIQQAGCDMMEWHLLPRAEAQEVRSHILSLVETSSQKPKADFILKGK